MAVSETVTVFMGVLMKMFVFNLFMLMPVCMQVMVQMTVFMFMLQ
jgi:hypothetical protein